MLSELQVTDGFNQKMLLVLTEDCAFPYNPCLLHLNNPMTKTARQLQLKKQVTSRVLSELKQKDAEPPKGEENPPSITSPSAASPTDIMH